jgi:hypothetical protein
MPMVMMMAQMMKRARRLIGSSFGCLECPAARVLPRPLNLLVRAAELHG